MHDKEFESKVERKRKFNSKPAREPVLPQASTITSQQGNKFDLRTSRLCHYIPGRILSAMATFSPSPAPRRSSRLQNRATSPSRLQRPHRLAATPSFITDSSSVASAMDIDERSSIMTDRSLSRIGGDMLFAKTDEMSVSFYANLPLEVKQVLRTSGACAYSGLNTHSLTGLSRL
jgi:hypothetical protein